MTGTDIKKILIFRLSSIGDIILTSPLLRSIRHRYPSAEISFVVMEEFAPLLRSNPHIDHLIPFNRHSGLTGLHRLAKLIRSKKIDLYIDIHKNMRSVYCRMLSGAKFKGTFSKFIWRRSILVSFGIDLYRHIPPVYLRYFDSVKKLDIHYDGAGTEVFIAAEIQSNVNALLGRLYDQDKKLIVICPGASFENKKWTKEGFVKLAAHFMADVNNKIVFLGGPKDISVCEDINSKLEVQALNFAGMFSLPESAALLKNAALVITNDSGMMHLAQAMKAPVVSIFGPTTHHLGFFPLPIKSEVVELKNLKCRPCTAKGLNKCPKGHFKCMTEIEAERVIEASKRMLS